jgi:hypothetical protein
MDQAVKDAFDNPGTPASAATVSHFAWYLLST